jgi:hypothetical protein
MFGGVDALHAAFLNESRTLGRLFVPRTGNPGISLVFREMWDTTALYPEPLFGEPAERLINLSTPNYSLWCGTGAPRSPQRTWAENEGAKPHDCFFSDKKTITSHDSANSPTELSSRKAA